VLDIALAVPSDLALLGLQVDLMNLVVPPAGPAWNTNVVATVLH
jgi:hypothetical protein